MVGSFYQQQALRASATKKMVTIHSFVSLMGDNSHLKHKNTAWNMYDIDENGHIARAIYPKWFHLMLLAVGGLYCFTSMLYYIVESWCV